MQLKNKNVSTQHTKLTKRAYNNKTYKDNQEGEQYYLLMNESKEQLAKKIWMEYFNKIALENGIISQKTYSKIQDKILKK